MKKVISILLVALLCSCTFVSTVAPFVYAESGNSLFSPLTDFVQVSDEALDELVSSYVDFYQDLGNGDILGALTTGAVDIPLDWLGFAGASLIETADACGIAGISPSTLVMCTENLKDAWEDSDLMYMVSEAGELLVYDGVNKLIRPVEATDEAKIDGSTFKALCNASGSVYCPKNTKDFISWRTNIFNTTADYDMRIVFCRNGFFCGDTWTNDVYLVPFYTDGLLTYYSAYQFHFYKELVKDDDGNYVSSLYCEYWNMLDELEPTTILITDKLLDYQYIDIVVPLDIRLNLKFYSTYTNYLNRNVTTSSNIWDSMGTTTLDITDMFCIDTNSGVYTTVDTRNLGLTSCFRKSVEEHDAACEYSDKHDIGYYCHNKPIEKDFSSVDFTKISDEDTVTLTGGTVYDYTITNNEGDTTTINNYITNNYTYPVTDTGNSGGEGSGTGGAGDVNVNVDVDVNNGANNLLPDIDGYVNYLEQPPEGFMQFFEKIFAFLPSDVLMLLLGGISVAIGCRVLGR